MALLREGSTGPGQGLSRATACAGSVERRHLVQVREVSGGLRENWEMKAQAPHSGKRVYRRSTWFDRALRSRQERAVLQRNSLAGTDRR